MTPAVPCLVSVPHPCRTQPCSVAFLAGTTWDAGVHEPDSHGGLEQAVPLALPDRLDIEVMLPSTRADDLSPTGPSGTT